MSKETKHDKDLFSFWDANEQRRLAKELSISVQTLRDAAYAVSKTKKPSRSVAKIKKYLADQKLLEEQSRQEEALQGDVGDVILPSN